MSTESDRRASRNSPVDRLALALVDILTGVVEVYVDDDVNVRGLSHRYSLHVKKAGIQDS